ncbi:MAG: Gfo/Idh/MocA family protein [Canibacter sp.]
MDATSVNDYAPLRIGVLGASRIAELAITDASSRTGDILAAVAARDPKRAAEFAERYGYERAHKSYEDLIADDSIDLLYIGLPNALHAEWTIRALEAGRNVLLEKPFASNLAEFDHVVEHLRKSQGWVWEAFHQVHHPVMRRFLELLGSGEFGAVQELTIQMDSPTPPDSDPRWSFDLSGGALMDVGCYGLHAVDTLADLLGEKATLLNADFDPFHADDRVEATVRAEYKIGSIPVHLHTSMLNDRFDFRLQAECENGTLIAPGFVRPFEDDRIITRRDGTEHVEYLGLETSYYYQLLAMRKLVRDSDRSEAGLARSRRVAARIDEVYTACELPLRPARTL